MVRTTTKNQINQTNGKSPSKKSKKNDSQSENSSDLSTSSESSSSSSRPASVHKQNLYVVSLPIIYFFNFLRFFLYQLFVVIKYIYNATTRILHRPIIKKDCEILDEQQQQNPNTITNSPAEIIEMSLSSRGGGPGPGDPLLAKQKHHHRRAFEYISKALKIDEENEGWFFFFYCLSFVLKNFYNCFSSFKINKSKLIFCFVTYRMGCPMFTDLGERL